MGRLGLLLAIPPGYAAPVWPPAGLALAACLVWGYRVWPGVVLGSFCVNIGTSFDYSTTAALARSLALASGIGLGAGSQAVLGAYLLHRFAHFSILFERESHILKFALLGGPVAGLTNATLGVLCLVAGGVVPLGMFFSHWWTWWVGDAIGALIFTPLVLVWFAGGAWRLRRWALTLPLGATLLLVVAIFVVTNRWETERIRLEFEQRAEYLGSSVERDLVRGQSAQDALRLFSGKNIELRIVDAATSAQTPSGEDTERLYWTRTVEVNGGIWRIELVPKATYLSGQQTWHVWLVLVGGLLFTGLLGVLLLVLMGRTERVEKQVEERTVALGEALEREQMLGQIRERILLVEEPAALHHLLRKELPGDLRRAGIPVHGISVQLFGSSLDYFVSTYHVSKSILVRREQFVEDYPWVGETWKSGQPVRVEREGLTEAMQASPAGLQTLLEVPLPQGGSMGINSKEIDAFDDKAVRVLQRCADWISSVISQFTRREAEALMRAQVRPLRAVLAMEAEEDFAQVMRVMAEELAELQLPYDALGANIFSAEGSEWEKLLIYRKDMRQVQMRSDVSVPADLLAHWQRGEVWEREWVVEDVNSDYCPHVVIDVPFAHGTLAIGLPSELGWHAPLIKLLQQFGGLLELGFARARDMAARRQSEEQLKLALVHAEAASLAKSQFLANMSHEIRTPMNAIIGLSGLLADEDLSEAQHHYIEGISTSSESLLGLLNDILDLSKIEAGYMELEEEPFALRKSLEDGLNALKWRAEDKGLDFSLDVAEAAPEVLVGDELRLRQILTNLVSNAIKFTAEGRISVGVESRGAGEDIEICIEVRDTGIGIPAAMREKIFEGFTQVDASSTRKYGGTGLGLSIASQLAALMGGHIALESEEGRGSSFLFCAPMRVALPSPAVAEPESATAASRPLRVLLAEDNHFNQTVARKVLENRGHEVELAENGHQVLLMLEQGTFDVVLMDVQMPDMDGLEATRQIRQREADSQSHVPIIALTAHAMQEDREQCMAAGMDDYLTKPIRPVQLDAALASIADAL